MNAAATRPGGPPPGRVRLADIAAQAGVSTATVSRVLNGKTVVSEGTRQAVNAALDVLGYERPLSTRTARSGVVGIVVPEVINPVFAGVAQEAGSYLAQAGFTPLVCPQSPGNTTEDEYVESLLDQGVAGILFFYGLHADTLASRARYLRLRERGLPIVLVGGHAPEVDAPQVSTDEATATRLAVRHLVNLGHERVGLAIGPERFTPSQRKLAGFTSALREAGLTLDDDEARRHVVATLYTLEGGQAAAAELLDTGHTAIVCASDIMALGAIRAARSRGLSVPGAVSVIGFDDSALMAFTDPPLTTVRQPVRHLCRVAVTALLAEIRGERATRSEILIEPELVVRGSTARVAR